MPRGGRLEVMTWRFIFLKSPTLPPLTRSYKSQTSSLPNPFSLLVFTKSPPPLSFAKTSLISLGALNSISVLGSLALEGCEVRLRLGARDSISMFALALEGP